MRLFLTLVASSFCLLPPAQVAAQTYPNKPIKIIAPFGPGSASDVTARALGKYWQEKWKQAVVVDNRSGANGLIGIEALAQAKPDGYTLGMATNSTVAAAPVLYKKLSYDPLNGFEHIGLVTVFGSVAIVPANSPHKRLADLVAHTKANPGKVYFAFADTSSRMPAELLGAVAGIELEGVSYKTVGNAITDVLAGQVDFMFVNYLAGQPHVAGGRVRALAVSEAKRAAVFPNVPAVAETYPGFEARGFVALAAPKGTPKDIVTRLNAALREAQATPWFRDLLEKTGGRVIATTAEQHRMFLLQETERWRDYARRAKVEPQ